ncbi:hypothetical protein [Flavimobilis marinus]|uniref:hypothetical protein n=1 Tax=Flavimobilis marinus TaxID=285351 RepID=UPI001FD13B9F|nr:hypothetical protein [Flavimobilis marinus]
MTAVLAVFVVTAISVGIFAQKNARGSQDQSAALAAAYAGVEEYQSRLANDTTYFQYGNPVAAFSSGSSVSLPPVEATNPAFGTGAAGSWARVAGSGGAADFRYEVDNSEFMASGTLRLRSTGRAGGETRTIVADLRQRAFIDYLYFTNYEIMDPEVSGADEDECVKYHYAGRPSKGCGVIAFGGNDSLNGKVHSNDAMRICEATFKGMVTTAYKPTSGVNYLKKNSLDQTCNGQVFEKGAPTVTKDPIDIPETNAELKREVRTDLPGDVPRPGCLYTGPTRITLNSDGTMTVRSPWTKATRIAGSPVTNGSMPSECGTPGTGPGQLGSIDGAEVMVPENNVVYVQDIPGTTGDPNYAVPPVEACKGAESHKTGNGIGYPTTNEVAPKVDSYQCKSGDVFIQGRMNGRMTIAAENYIYITGDIRYVDNDDDVLGLIGNNAVFVWNPVTSRSATILRDYDRHIDAAMMSVGHTFQVQNYNKGSYRGTLKVNGSIIQNFRGTVATGTSTGYKKDYMYDDRYMYLAPPKFLNPVKTTYGVTKHAEVEPAFDVDGS